MKKPLIFASICGLLLTASALIFKQPPATEIEPVASVVQSTPPQPPRDFAMPASQEPDPIARGTTTPPPYQAALAPTSQSTAQPRRSAPLLAPMPTTKTPFAASTQAPRQAPPPSIAQSQIPSVPTSPNTSISFEAASSFGATPTDVAIEVPADATVPMALMDLSTEDGFTADEIAKIGQLANEFVQESSSPNAGSPSEKAKVWDSAQKRSDELFRTWYGDDAYQALAARRYFEGLGSTGIATNQQNP